MQLRAIFPHEVKNFLFLLLAEIVVHEQARISITIDLTDTEHLVTLRIDRQVQKVTARLQSLKVRLNFALTLVIKGLVGDEDDRAVEVESVGDTFLTQETRILVVRNTTGLARIQRTLQDVDSVLIFPNIAIVKNQNILGIRILVQKGKQTNRGHSALNNLEPRLLAGQLVKQSCLLHLGMNTVTLADARRASNDHCTDITRNASEAHLIKDFKTLFDTVHSLFIGLGNNFNCGHHGSLLHRTVDIFNVTDGVNLDLDGFNVNVELTIILDGDVVAKLTSLKTLDQGKDLVLDGLVTIRTRENANSRHKCSVFQLSRKTLYDVWGLLSNEKIVGSQFFIELAKSNSSRDLFPNCIENFNSNVAVNSLQKQGTVGKVSVGVSHRLDNFQNLCFVDHLVCSVSQLSMKTLYEFWDLLSNPNVLFKFGQHAGNLALVLLCDNTAMLGGRATASATPATRTNLCVMLCTEQIRLHCCTPYCVHSIACSGFIVKRLPLGNQ